MDLRINESMMEPTGAENKKAQRKLQNLDWRDVIHDSITSMAFVSYHTGEVHPREHMVSF